jgi:hypothetical protein
VLNAPPARAPLPPERRQTLRSWCDARFESAAVKAALAAWACHVALGPDDEGSAGIAHDFAMVIQSEGNDVVQGGMQQLCEALASVLRAHGGAIRTGARVEKILVERGQAVGVRLAGGEETACHGPIACNANPARVILEFLDETDAGADIVAKMRRYQHRRGVRDPRRAHPGSERRAAADPGARAVPHPRRQRVSLRIGEPPRRRRLADARTKRRPRHRRGSRGAARRPPPVSAARLCHMATLVVPVTRP